MKKDKQTLEKEVQKCAQFEKEVRNSNICVNCETYKQKICGEVWKKIQEGILSPKPNYAGEYKALD